MNDDGSTFYFDVGEIVRFRVETEEWHDQIPNAPELADMPVQERKPPYSIIVRDTVSCWCWTGLTDLLGFDADGRPWARCLVVKCIFNIQALHFLSQIRYPWPGGQHKIHEIIYRHPRILHSRVI